MGRKKEKPVEPGTYSVTEYAEKSGLTRQTVLYRINQKILTAGVSAKRVGKTYTITVKAA